jgi:hypothetical protein
LPRVGFKDSGMGYRQMIEFEYFTLKVLDEKNKSKNDIPNKDVVNITTV